MGIRDYNAVAALNSLISGVNTAEGMPPRNVNDAFRQCMADLKAFTVKGQFGDTAWLETMIPATESASTMTSIHPLAGIGVLGATETRLSANAGGDSSHGGSFYAINNNTAYQQNAHGAYTEARRVGNSGSTISLETAICTTGTAEDTGPYTAIPASGAITTALMQTSGRNDIAGSTSPCTARTIYKGFTGKGFRAGDVWDYQSLDPTSPLNAVMFPSPYTQVWRNTDGHNDIALGGGALARFQTWSATLVPTFEFYRARAAGADTQVGDTLGLLSFYQRTSGADEFRASINVSKQGPAHSAIGFSATDSASVLRTIVLSDNVFYPTTDNSTKLGNASQRWNVVYAGTGTINTSDARTKKQLGTIPPEVLAAVREIDIVQFKFLDAIAEKGEEAARKHTGVIAQQIIAVFEAHGLDALEWGFVGKDAWMVDTEEPYEETEAVMREERYSEPVIEHTPTGPIQTTRQATRMVPVLTDEVLRDADGNIIMEAAKPGEWTTSPQGIVYRAAEIPARPRTVPVPVYATVTKTRTVRKQKLDESGQPMDLLSIRPDELLFAMMAAMREE